MYLGVVLEAAERRCGRQSGLGGVRILDVPDVRVGAHLPRVGTTYTCTWGLLRSDGRGGGGGRATQERHFSPTASRKGAPHLLHASVLELHDRERHRQLLATVRVPRDVGHRSLDGVRILEDLRIVTRASASAGPAPQSWGIDARPAIAPPPVAAESPGLPVAKLPPTQRCPQSCPQRFPSRGPPPSSDGTHEAVHARHWRERPGTPATCAYRSPSQAPPCQPSPPRVHMHMHMHMHVPRASLLTAAPSHGQCTHPKSTPDRCRWLRARERYRQA